MDTETDNLSESAAADRQGAVSTEPAERRGLPLDETFEILRNQRRRYVLQYLEGAGEVSLGELAEQIAAWENGKDIKQITSSERKRVYVGLYQCHLPKMDGMGVISFNKPRGLIERGEHVESVEPYVHRMTTPERSAPTGPTVGLPIAGATMVPIAILLLSQSTLSLGIAASVALAATVWGAAALLRDASGETADATEMASQEYHEEVPVDSG